MDINPLVVTPTVSSLVSSLISSLVSTTGMSVPTKLTGTFAGQSLAEYLFLRGTPRVANVFAQSLSDGMGYTSPRNWTLYTTPAPIATNAATQNGTDYSVRLVNYASGGSVLVDVSGGGGAISTGNYWWNTQNNSATSPGGVLDAVPNTPGPLLRALIAGVGTYGSDFGYWSQGQSDAVWIQSNYELYKSVLILVLTAWRTAAGNANMPIFFAHIDRGNVASPAGIELVAKVQSELSESMTNVRVATEEYLSSFGIVASHAACTTSTTVNPTIVLTANTTGMTVNDQIIGAGIPDGAYITAINPGVSFTMNTSATASGTVTLYRLDPTHPYPGADGIQPLDSNGNTTHNTNEGFYNITKRAALNISRSFLTNTAKKYFGPEATGVSSAWNTNQIDVTIAHDQGTDLTTLNGAITAASLAPWRVENNGNVMSLSNIQKINPNLLRITTGSSVLAGPLKVWPVYGAMNRSNYKDFIIDNATIPQPLARKSPDVYPALTTTISVGPRFDLQTTGFNNCVSQWDATLAASYPGSGVNLLNVIPAPVDLTTPSVYDMNSVGATFTGSVGDAAALFSTGTNFRFELIGANTTYLNSLHKDTQDYTLIFAYKVSGTGNASIFSTQSSTTTQGISIDTTTTITSRQRGDSVTGGSVSGGTITTDTWYLLIVSHQGGTINSRRWLNSRTAAFQNQAFAASSLDASINMHIGSRADTTNNLPIGSSFVGAAMLNTYCDDALANKIFDYYNNLHGRTYA